MKNCQIAQDLFVDALYGGLSKKEQSELDVHLDQCDGCRKLFDNMKSTISLMDQRVRPEPDERFLVALWDKVEDKLDDGQSGDRTEDPVRTRFIPMWVYQTAAAVLILVSGIYLGQFMSKDNSVDTIRSGHRSGIAMPAELQTRTNSYLAKSRVLIMGLVNIDTNVESAADIDFSLQRKYSQKMVQEAAYLKEALDQNDQQRLQELVTELERVLLQISNLEAQSDLSAVEIIRDGVERNGILFKINLEEMKKRSPKKDNQPQENIL